ncbi:MAG: SH3 domain-containing protein [Gammaproteobacteria bacterium]
MDQNVRNKLNEIRQKQLESYTNLQTVKPSSTASNKSLIIAVLGGVATGFITAWLMNSFLSTESVDLIAQKSRVVFYEDEIRGVNKTIEQLNDRVELLSKSVSSLEFELNEKVEKITITDQDIPEPADEKPVSTLAASEAADNAAISDKTFIPTHVVKDRLNLRSSTSRDDAPIGVLSAGTRVSYIDEVNGWYYVDTEQLGKGWCASEYLSPLSSP